MKYRIQHITEYQYEEPVSHCYNMAHLMPRDSERQTCLSSDIQVTPQATKIGKRIDYFGNRVHHFEIQEPHQNLKVTSISEIETHSQNMNLAAGLSCKQVLEKIHGSASEETRMAREYTLESPVIPLSADLKYYALELFKDNVPFLSSVYALTQKIFAEFKYAPKATTINTPLSEILEKRHGVCQDFAHIQIGCLRSLGFAARYVSGYLENLPLPGQEKLIGSDASHAWVAVYVPDQGWFEFDPTNNCVANEQHIITSWGRDFVDVTPFCGVIFGGGAQTHLNVSVHVERTENFAEA